MNKIFDTKKAYWRLLTVYGGLSKYKRQTTICELFWHTLLAIFWVSVIVFCCAFLVGTALILPICLVLTLFGIPLNLEYGPLIFSIVITFSTTVACIIIWGLHMKWKREDEREYVLKEPKSPGLIKLAYRAFKEKTCFLVDLDKIRG